jgi:polyisoprenoid-binding protein YceI
MKTLKFKSLAVFVLALSLTTSVFAGTQKVDASKSTVKWTGKKVTGEHTGTVAIKEGNLVADNGKITSGRIVMDMTSIVDKDLTDAEWNAKLIGHLKSDDFFAVATHPTSELVLTKVEGNGNTSVFTGNLTIKGITNPVTFNATSAKDGKNTNFVGTLTIDRTKYNMKFGSKSFFENLGDKVVYDDFTLAFNLVVTD